MKWTRCGDWCFFVCASMCVLACVSLLNYSPYSQSLETERNHVLITKKRPFFQDTIYLWEDNLRAKQYSVECKQSSSSVTWERTLKQTRLMVSAWLAFISKSSACLDHSTVRPCKDFLCLFPVGTIRFLFFETSDKASANVTRGVREV